jgi:hypothetical protein
VPKLVLGKDIPEEIAFTSPGIGVPRVAFRKIFKQKYPEDKRDLHPGIGVIRTALHEYTAEKIMEAGENPGDYYSPAVARVMARHSRPQKSSTKPARGTSEPARVTTSSGTKAPEVRSKRGPKLVPGKDIPEEIAFTSPGIGVPRVAFRKIFKDEHPEDKRDLAPGIGVIRTALHEYTAEKITKAGENPDDYYSPAVAKVMARHSRPQKSSTEPASGTEAAARGNTEIRLRRMLKRRLSHSPMAQYSADPFAYILNPGKR